MTTNRHKSRPKSLRDVHRGPAPYANSPHNWQRRNDRERQTNLAKLERTRSGSVGAAFTAS